MNRREFPLPEAKAVRALTGPVVQVATAGLAKCTTAESFDAPKALLQEIDNEHSKRLAAGRLDPERHLLYRLWKATRLDAPRTGLIAGLGGPIAVRGEPGGSDTIKAVPPEAECRPAV